MEVQPSAARPNNNSYFSCIWLELVQLYHAYKKKEQEEFYLFQLWLLDTSFVGRENLCPMLQIESICSADLGLSSCHSCLWEKHFYYFYLAKIIYMNSKNNVKNQLIN